MNKSGRPRKHGAAINGKRPPEYKTWVDMKQRCSNKNRREYKHYGARGIRVCDRWLGSYQNFISDMGPRPSPSHSIDRVDNNGNYEPVNCRWATQQEQVNNCRHNRRLLFGGEMKTMTEISRLIGIPVSTLYCRIKVGMPNEKLFFKGSLCKKQNL